jgi:hypothetical protein
VMRTALEDRADVDLHKFFRTNATRFYRIPL